MNADETTAAYRRSSAFIGGRNVVYDALTSNSTPARPSAFWKAPACPKSLPAPARSFDMPAMALLDRNGVYGSPRFHMAAKKAGVRAHIGCEITCTNGRTYPLLAETREGYQNLCRLVTRMKLRATKGEGAATLEEFAEFSHGLICLTAHPDERLLDIFGTHASLRRTAAPSQSRGGGAQPGHHRARPPSRHPAGRHQRARLRRPRAARTAGRLHLRPQQSHARHRRPPAGAQLRAPRQSRRRNGAALRRSARSHRQHARDLRAPGVHAGRSGLRVPALSRARRARRRCRFLRKLTDEGARRRYRPYHERARQQIERELALIEKLKLPATS